MQYELDKTKTSEGIANDVKALTGARIRGVYANRDGVNIHVTNADKLEVLTVKPTSEGDTTTLNGYEITQAVVDSLESMNHQEQPVTIDTYNKELLRNLSTSISNLQGIINDDIAEHADYDTIERDISETVDILKDIFISRFEEVLNA